MTTTPSETRTTIVLIPPWSLEPHKYYPTYTLKLQVSPYNANYNPKPAFPIPATSPPQQSDHQFTNTLSPTRFHRYSAINPVSLPIFLSLLNIFTQGPRWKHLPITSPEPHRRSTIESIKSRHPQRSSPVTLSSDMPDL